MSPARLTIFFVLTLGLGGCLPGAAWLPDSSGFYFTTGKDNAELHFFDLKTKKAVLVVKDTQTNCAWPAISPDGKRIALAKVVRAPKKKGRPDPTTMEVAVFYRDGKEKQRTKPFEWDDGETIFNPLPWVFWIPGSEKLLINGGIGTVGVLDLNNETWTKIEGAYLATFGGTPFRPEGVLDLNNETWTKIEGAYLATFGGTPFRPDGKGFVVLKLEKDDDEKPPSSFVAFDFSGKPTAKIPLEGVKVDPKGQPPRSEILLLAFQATTNSAWTKNGATANWDGYKLTIDLGKKTAKYEAGKPPANDEGHLILLSYSLNAKTTLKLIGIPQENREPGKLSKLWLEAVADGKKTVLLENCHPCVFLPAPDGKTFAVRCDTSGGNWKQETILVVNAQGEVLAELKGKR